MNNFAVITINYWHLTNAIIAFCTTDNPCHLTLHHTTVDPRKHQVTRTVRGLTVPWKTYFCFVAWTPVEQTEAGDTLIHSFIIPSWYLDGHRYFAITGTVSAIDSPSCSPIFTHTHTGLDLIHNPSYEVFTSPPNPPDGWLGLTSSPFPNNFWPDFTHPAFGTQSCATIPPGDGFFSRLYQLIDVNFTSNLHLNFYCWYRSLDPHSSFVRVRAYGAVTRIKYAYPVPGSDWQQILIDIITPPALTRLYYELDVSTPLGWINKQVNWDNCELYLL